MIQDVPVDAHVIQELGDIEHIVVLARVQWVRDPHH